MTYFLGRDIAVGLTTEQPHYALELDSGDLKISGTSSNAFDADKVFVPKRNAIGTTAESTKISIIGTAAASDFESTATNNKYILLYSESGEKYLIWFDEGTDNAVKPAGLDEDFNLEVAMSGNNVAMATVLRNAITGNTAFNNVFTVAAAASGSDNNVNITNKVAGSAVDTERGSGFDNTIVTVQTTTDGANDDLTDLTNGVVLEDVTGIDFTYGTTDEDVAYFGQKTALKAEIKKEITLSITKKKKNAGYSQLANEARSGIRSTDNNTSEMTEESDNVELDNKQDQPFVDAQGSGYGYRLYLQLKKSNEVLSLPNMCITEYNVSLGADSIQEETIVFYGNVTPIMGTLPDDTETSEANF
tara:strand:- start:803 stop:1882 length:1080 start_codon:yes stop_codon:yes gene_type:complete